MRIRAPEVFVSVASVDVNEDFGPAGDQNARAVFERDSAISLRPGEWEEKTGISVKLIGYRYPATIEHTVDFGKAGVCIHVLFRGRRRQGRAVRR